MDLTPHVNKSVQAKHVAISIHVLRPSDATDTFDDDLPSDESFIYDIATFMSSWAPKRKLGKMLFADYQEVNPELDQSRKLKIIRAIYDDKVDVKPSSNSSLKFGDIELVITFLQNKYTAQNLGRVLKLM